MGRIDYILDTNVLISLYRSKRKTELFFSELAIRDFYISVVSHVEFLGGATPKRKADSRKFLSDFVVLAVEKEVNETLFSMCMKEQISKHKLADFIIAATALTYNLTLITENHSDFKYKGLKLIKFSPGWL